MPITPADALTRVIRPAFELLPAKMGGERAEVMVLAIMLQESELAARVQHGDDPARGLAKFELGGGIHEVMTHPASRDLARKVLAVRACPATERSAWLALAGDDLLAACFARLLLYTDELPLPTIGDVDTAWKVYVRNWRPDKPRPIDWPGNYELAMTAVFSAEESA